MHYRRDGKMSEGNNKKNTSENNILWDSIRDKVKRVRKDPAKVLLVPPLCVGYAMILGALYLNVLIYHARPKSRL